MKRSQLEEIIREEIYKTLAEIEVLGEPSLDEKSVPQPYNRKNRRRMSDDQIESRDSIGKKIKGNKKADSRQRGCLRFAGLRRSRKDRYGFFRRADSAPCGKAGDARQRVQFSATLPPGYFHRAN